MSKIQKLIIILILLLPMIVGIAIFVRKNSGSAVLGGSAFKRIGLVRVQGVIGESSDWIRQLRSFRLDNSVAGVILRIDSPGGAVAPSQEIYTEVTRYAREKKLLIVSMGSVAASGGYYIASPAHLIFADPGTLTGSLGVIFTIPLFKELTEKIGIDFRVYKAGRYKDIASPYRKITDTEQQIIQNLLDDTHDQFISDVAAARGLPLDSVRALADGRIFTGRQAVAYKLVDTLGGYEDALSYLKTRLNLPDRVRPIERRQRQTALREWLVEEISHVFPSVRQAFAPLGVYYLFRITQ